MSKIILDLCAGTGSWSKHYQDSPDYDVRLITLPETDVRLYAPPLQVHGVLAAPPCTEFSFAKHFHGKGNYDHDFRKGLEIVSACMRIILTCQPVWWCLENPRGYLRKWLGNPAMSLDPWEYGDNYQKKTDLWGKFNIPIPTAIEKPLNVIKFSMLKSREIAPEWYGKLSRTERRAITPKGFAKAFFEANP
jgi:hypothetical protein